MEVLGYLAGNGKHAKGKMDKWVLLDEPPKKGDYVITYKDVVKIDIDDYNHKTGELDEPIRGKSRSEAVIQYLDDNNINYIGVSTDSGVHLIFKKPQNYNCNQGKNCVNWYCAFDIKIEALVNSGSIENTKVVNEPVKIHGKKRKCFKNDFITTNIDELPICLYPLTKLKKDKRNTCIYFDTDVRNSDLSKYAFYLNNKGIKNEEDIKKIITHINFNMLDNPLDKSELETILRDETFSKMGLDANEGNKIRLDYTIFNNYLKEKHYQIKFDEMKKKIVYSGFSDDYKNKEGDFLTLNDIVTVLHLEMLKNIPQIRKTTQWKEVYNLVHYEYQKNKFNAIQEYILSCKWDKKRDCIKEIFDILGVTDRLEQILIRKWLVQCVAMAFNDGSYGAEGILILTGREGIGKSSFFKSLVHDVKYYDEISEAFNTSKRDNVMRITESWIVEISEIDETLKLKQSTIKSFVTTNSDKIRLPYEREIEEFKRLSSLCGTTNEEKFLYNNKDARRWWIIPINKTINWQKIDDEFRSNLWGQCYYLFNNNCNCFRLDNEVLQNKVAIHDKKYMYLPPIEEILIRSLKFETNVNTWRKYTLQELVIKIPPLTKYVSLDNTNDRGMKVLGQTLTDMMKNYKGIEKKRSNKGITYKLPDEIDKYWLNE
ncbi:MAG: hypothetical protein LUH02_01225 [Erysipelotrichaceae bacterium]|nr:hypothetical protein [Erysipelotrichaceae bacterium]